MRHFGSQGTQDTQALEHLRHPRHSKRSGTRALEALKGHLGAQGTQVFEEHLGNRALKKLGHLGTQQALGLLRHLRSTRHLGTRELKVLGHLGTQALEHSGTRKALGHSNTWHWRTRDT